MNNTICINRIMRDFKATKNNSCLDENNIYTHIDENNIYTIYSLHIGDSNTPYSGGFYLFEWKFNNNYPFQPPTGTFCTAGNYVRFHPNFYNERDKGKVCLSILNTFKGPKWTSVHTLESILITIKSIMTENPIHNEPGYENDTKHSLKYNKIILFNNYYIAVYRNLKYTPDKFKVFLPIMEKYFITHFNTYYTHLLELQKFNNIIIFFGIYNLTEKLKYSRLLRSFVLLYNSICEKYAIIPELYSTDINIINYHTDTSLTNLDVNINNTVLVDNVDNTNKKIKKKYPILKACFREVDHIHTYMNTKFIVYLDKRGYKRWREVK
jgi:ubiquitin-conjugating enzyme E2 Z